jgi:lipopolysaccharide biosynthesis glycosyltransferase
MVSKHASIKAIGKRDPIVVLAADDSFAMPLAVTVRSALDSLSPDRKLRLYVIDGGIRATSKQRMLQSWPAGRYSVEWLKLDTSTLAGLPCSGHINLVSYYRILIARVLPAEFDRAIYLDADLIVRADLARLWDHDMAGCWCLAAPDCSAPYLDSSQVLPNYQTCQSLLGSAQPVPNYRDLGLDGHAAYFNAGVLVIDLAAWRSADLARRSLECLEQHRKHVVWWDQYALNVVLAGHWSPLDARWNQGSHVFMYPTWKQSPFEPHVYQQLRDDPYIVHFTTRSKPWMSLCNHPFREEFYRYLDRTAWAGWRPSRFELIMEMLRTLERRVRKARKSLLYSASQWM